MAQVKVSIVIPAYNCEHTIVDLIESITKKIVVSYEIIIVDDGSTDLTGKILDRYAHMEHFFIIHKENEGAPIARNTGLEIAKGEYIYFCDADDLVYDVAVLEKMIDVADKQKHDVVLADLVTREANGHNKRSKPIKNIKDICQYYFCSPIPGTKIFKTAFLNDNHIRFDNVKIGQDVNFYLKCVSLAESIGYVKEVLYVYLRANSVISKTYKLDNLLQIKDSVMLVMKFCEEHGKLTSERKKIFEYVKLCHYTHQLKKKIHINKADYNLLRTQLCSEVDIINNFDLKLCLRLWSKILQFELIKRFNIVLRDV